MNRLSTFLILLCFSAGLKGQFVVNGDAFDLGGGCFQITENVLWQAGSVFHPNLIDLNQPFAIRTSLNFGTADDLGADGLAFLLQPISSVIGTSGGGMGYQGISPSLAVEFDTHQNLDLNDPFTDHVSIQRDGILDHLSSATLMSPVNILPSSGNSEDGLFHTVLITWDPVTLTMEVEVDCSVRISYTGDIVATIFSGNPLVYAGFTGSTGGLSNAHSICFEFLELNEGPDSLTICLGDEAVIEGPAGFVGYNWSPSTGLDDPTIANPLASPLATTLYTVSFSDDCGNSYIDSFVVVVDPGPAPSFDLGADTALCTGSSILLSGPAGVDSYQWSNSSTSSSITASAGNSYWLIASLGVCSSSDTIVIEEIFLDLDLGDDVTACGGDSVLVGPDPVSGWSYSWSNGISDATQWLSVPGNYILTVDSAGCTGMDVVNFDFSAFPDVMVPDSASWCEDAPFSVTATGNATSWLWSNGETGLVLEQVSAPGFYWVAGTLEGCVATDTVVVYEFEGCNCQPQFPNAFTPDGDGLNDRFYGRQADICTNEGDHELRIYDRWGKQVFSGSGMDASWNGSFLGNELPIGSYVWISDFSLNGENTRSSGKLTLIR